MLHVRHHLLAKSVSTALCCSLFLFHTVSWISDHILKINLKKNVNVKAHDANLIMTDLLLPVLWGFQLGQLGKPGSGGPFSKHHPPPAPFINAPGAHSSPVKLHLHCYTSSLSVTRPLQLIQCCTPLLHSTKPWTSSIVICKEGFSLQV